VPPAVSEVRKRSSGVAIFVNPDDRLRPCVRTARHVLVLPRLSATLAGSPTTKGERHASREWLLIDLATGLARKRPTHLPNVWFLSRVALRLQYDTSERVWRVRFTFDVLPANLYISEWSRGDSKVVSVEDTVGLFISDAAYSRR
jgi:hypothetical protein